MRSYYIQSTLSMLFIALFLACKPDAAPVASDENVENVAEDTKEAPTASQESKSAPASEFNKGKSGDWTDTVAVDFTTPAIEKEVPITEKADLKEETKALVSKSFNAGKDCASILKAYEKFIKKSAENLTAEAIAELTKWTNDPLYNDCYSRDKSFREKADALDELLE